MTAREPVADAAIAYDETVMPDDVDFAHIVNGILQVTPDIDDESTKGTVLFVFFQQRMQQLTGLRVWPLRAPSPRQAARVGL